MIFDWDKHFVWKEEKLIFNRKEINAKEIKKEEY